MSLITSAPMALGAPVPSKLLLNLKLHRAPSLNAPSVTLNKGTDVIVYSAPLVKADGFTFAYVTDAQGNSGYMVTSIPGYPSFDPPMLLPTDPARTFRLHPPFAQYVIVSKFNAPRPNYATQYPGKLALHEGCDFEPASNVCDPVVHVGAPGKVAKVDFQANGYGNYIIVDHADGWQTVYAHFADVYVKAGHTLAEGQIIGLQGSTGSSSEPHVHITLSNPKTGLSGYVYPFVVDPETVLVK